MTLEVIFEELRNTRAPSGEGHVRRRLFEKGALDLFAQCRKPDNRQSLCLWLSKPIPEVESLPECRGLSIKSFVGADGKSILELAARDPEYQDLFILFGNSLSARLAGIVDESRASDALLGELYRWLAFLEQIGPEGLTEVAQRGLFGELWFLRGVLLPLGPKGHAVNAWTGPERALHDYQLPGIACEIKTVSGKAPYRVRIASEKQLETASLRLLLYCLFLTPHLSEGDTLPGVVADIRSTLSGKPEAAGGFEARLFRAGFLDQQAPKYERRRYLVNRSSFFEVENGFPRLVSGDLPTGVGDVGYSIALAACQGFAMAEGDAHAALRKGLCGE